MSNLDKLHVEKQIELTEMEGRQLVATLVEAEISLTEYKKRLDALFNSLRGIQKFLEER